MRINAGTVSVIRLIAASCLAIGTLSAAAAGKAAKVLPPVLPKTGIKTPGVQIAFAQIKAEATLETPDKPTWMYFAAAVAGGGGRGGGAGRGAAAAVPDATATPVPATSAPATSAPATGAPANGGRGAAGGPGRGAAEPGAGNLFVPATDKVLKFDTRDNKAGEPIAGVNKPCGGAVSAFTSLWVASCGDGTLLRLDPRTLKVKATIASGAVDVRGGLAASADSIWLITDGKQTIVRIDPDQDAVVAEFRVPAGCGNMMFAEAALWLTCPEQNKILKINPATNLIDKRIDVGAKPLALASGQGSIWVLCGKEGKIDRIDPKTDKVTKTLELATPEIAGGMVYGEGYLWVTATGFPLTRIDIGEADKERVAQQFFGDGGGAIFTSSGAIWLSNLNIGTVSRIDPKLVLATLAE